MDNEREIVLTQAGKFVLGCLFLSAALVFLRLFVEFFLVPEMTWHDYAFVGLMFTWTGWVIFRQMQSNP